MPTLRGRAAARVHAGGIPAVRRAHRRVEVRFVDRHERARGLHARGPQRPRAAAHGGARSGAARDRQLPARGSTRNASRRTIRSGPIWASARCRSRASCGSSATTTRRTRPRAISASRPGPRCGCATATSSGASAPTRTPPATWRPSTARTTRRRAAGTPGADARKVKGNIHWLSAAARGSRRGAAVRPAVRGPVPGRAQSVRARAATVPRPRPPRSRAGGGRRGRR